ncbi:MAG: AAA family ATPase [Oscillospiraceae bacterium]|nr:AAA family ATPase [Oscillospiraceae bacterium]
MSKKGEKKDKGDKKKSKKKMYYGIIAAVLIIVLAVSAYMFFFASNDDNDEEADLTYTELIRNISEGTVKSIEMRTGSNSITVEFNDEDKEEQTVIVPNIQAFMEFIQEEILEGNELEVTQLPVNILVRTSQTAVALLPTAMIAVLIIIIIKMQGLGDKGKVYDAEADKETQTTFEDVAGLEEEKGELIEIVNFLKEPDKFYEMGAKIPKGILLCGKPGTGKTLIARAIAGEANVPFIQMSGSEFIEMFAGLGASRVRKLFERAKKMSPCIVFIDEIDAIGARRTSASGAETENNQTLNQLLVEMDGFQKGETVIVLAATNRPEMLDKALLRPGRFDRQITIAAPDVKGREEILKIHSRNKKFAEGITLRSIAEDTAGFTGAELENVLNEAAIIATINKHEAIEMRRLRRSSKKSDYRFAKA